MEISIKWNLCRVCLLEEQKACKTDSSIQFVPLFKEKKLALQIYELCGISMKPEDSLPDKICSKCVSIINNAMQLRKTCLSSDSYLQAILARTKSASALFKPDIPPAGGIDDIGDDSNSGNEEMEMHHSVFDGESEHEVIEKQNKISEASHEQKCDIKSEDPLYYSEVRTAEIEEINDNVSDYTVELEEIIDMSEDEFIAQTVEGDEEENLAVITDKNKDNREISQIQKFYMNANFGKQKNDNEETHSDTATEAESIEQDKTEEQSCYDSDKEGMPDNEESVSNQGLGFAEIDEEVKPEIMNDDSMTMKFAEQINKNEDQAQVSSTVQTREEVECFNDDSNISNITSDLYKERSNEAYINNSKISSTYTSTALSVTKSQQKRYKPKRSVAIKTETFFKNTAYEPIQLSVCEICGNRFTNQNQMKLHMKIHLQHRSHQCELCPKSFITACNLQAHMRIHTGEKPFECKYCGRRFNDRSSHLRHERTHTNEKPFECENCGKTFALATTLQNHMKVHTDERSYRCEPCGKSFKLPHHLKKHVTTSLHLSIVQITEDS